MKVRNAILGVLLVLFLTGNSSATPTSITVRVLSKGAKFVGTSMGGAGVLVKDAHTGALLAQGVTRGTTGSTEKIMKEPWVRGTAISDEKSAQFTASIDIDEPKLLKITAYGPLSQPQAINKVTTTQWVIPGKDISSGDAFMLVLPGMVVDILSPPTHISLKGVQQEVRLEANVAMM